MHISKSVSQSGPAHWGYLRGALPAPILTLFFMCFWHFRSAGALSLQAFGAYLLLTMLFGGYGQIVLALVRDSFFDVAGFPLQLLSGFFVFNTIFFVLTLVSTLGMPVNLSIMVLLCVVGLWAVARRRTLSTAIHDPIPVLIALLVSGVAATVWVSDSQMPILVRGDTAIFQTWKDTFIHVREISEFAQARGVTTIHDIRLAGAPAPIYHFASYVSPAAVTLLASLTALEAYSSFLLPFGIFLTGLGAFSLIATLFGRWPAMIAAAAIVLLPDAYQQGFGNRYLSYNFLAQVNPGMLYGIACAAIAWLLMIEGCRREKYGYLLLSYLFLVVCLFYKAHVFVANAFLILIYPCLFFTRIKSRTRAILGVFGVALFVSVIALSQTTGKVPLLKLDFSGISHYVIDVLKNFDQGLLKEFFTSVFTVEKHSRLVQGLYAVTMILLSTFGLWLAALGITLGVARKRVKWVVLAFPILVLVNYVVMSNGLAYDTRGIGSPDEMMNRPLVWAYYVVAAWTAGAAYFLAFGDRLPPTSAGKIGTVVAGLAALCVPLSFSHRWQTFPARNMAQYSEFNAAPLCFVKAAQFIRINSRAGAIVQDSKNDPTFLLSALAERQNYASAGAFGPLFKPVQDRIDALNTFMAMSQLTDIQNFANEKRISWFLLRPDQKVAWPSSVSNSPKFECDQYRLFYFPDP